MKIQISKTFKEREDLDSFVRNNFGEDSNKNKEIVLELSEKELTDLSLSEETSVYGVKIRKENN